MRRQRSCMTVLAGACAGVVAVGSVLTSSARAAIATWDGTGAGMLWSDNANWNPDGAVEANDARFGAVGAVVSAGGITNIVDANTSVLSLMYSQAGLAGTANQHTTQINDGLTLTINGTSGPVGTALYVGSNNDNLAVANQTGVRFVNAGGTPASSASGGTLRIDNPLADLQVRQTSSNTAGGTRQATLDLSGLSFFNANLRDFYVGVGDPSNAVYNRAIGSMTLAYNNTINANSIQVGHNPNNGTTFTNASRFFLGQTNVINTNSITVGGHTTSNNLAGFMAGISGGTVQIRGAGGVGRADLLIGAQLAGVTSATSATNNVVDFSGTGGLGTGSGSVDARLGTVTLGRVGFTTNATGTARNAAGTLTYNAGLIDADTVILGDDNNTANAPTGTGTLNVNGTAQLVVNNGLTLGRKQNAANATTITGTLNVSGGTSRARVTGAISDGGGTSTINVNNGASLQARALGGVGARIDNFTSNVATVVVDIASGLPAGAWGYVTNFSPTATTVGLNFAPGTLSAGQTIHAIDYTSLGGGGFAALSMAKQPARVAAHLANGANVVDIVIDSADSPKWDGTAGNNAWDIGVSNNWKLITAGTATNYQEDLVNYSTTDSVLFNDDAAETNVNVSTTVAPNSIVVNNPTKSYTLGGTGKITGATGITKQGAGTLTVSNSGGNDFTGAIDIQGGTVSTGASNVLPDTGTINVATAGGTFSLGDNSETVGAVTVAGGNATVNNGTLNVGTIGVTGGSLAITGTGTIAANIMNYSGSAASVALGSGSLTATTLNLSNGATLNPGGSMAVTTVNIDNATLGAGPLSANAINVTSSGTINSTVGGVATFTKTGTGTVTVSGNNTYTGGTRLEDGILLITSDNALGATSGNTFIENGGNTGAGYLGLSGNITVAEPITLSGRRGFTPSNTPPYNFNPHIVNVSGNNTISGDITLFTGGTNHNLGSDAGKLTIAGNIINSINTSPALTRFLHLRGVAEGEISGNILVTGTETQDIVKLDSGTWTLSGSNNAQMGNTQVQAGTLVFAGPLHRTNTIDVQGTSSAIVKDGGGSARVLRANTVSIAAGAKLDLKDNKLITNTAAGTSSGGIYNGIQGEVQRAYNFGAWDQAGLTTSMPDAAAGLTTIGVATGEQVRGLGPTDTDTFAGQTITGASVIGMYTYAGDANLDGTIDGGDYGIIDNFVQVPGADGYANGDFNYDGVIDGGDYGIIDNNIQAQGAPFPTSGSAGLSGVTAVPEPSACGLALLMSAGLFGRRRRRCRRVTL